MYEKIFCTHSISVQEVKAMKNSSNTQKLVVPGAKQAIEQMKYEIANELGVTMGPDATSRANGSVGGEITKRLVQMGEQHLGGSNYTK
jgi:small acid-soluble spore protein A (major alpha-type SASP)